MADGEGPRNCTWGYAVCNWGSLPTVHPKDPPANRNIDSHLSYIYIYMYMYIYIYMYIRILYETNQHFVNNFQVDFSSYVGFLEAHVLSGRLDVMNMQGSDLPAIDKA